ncbi:MAG: MarR family transcriptional regulator [Chloroflexota bacterium]
MNKNTSTTEDNFLEAFIAIGRQMRTRIDSELEDAGLSGIQLWALKNLIDTEELLGISQLAACINSGRSNATQLVDRMESDGLVKRVPHPEDRRSVQIQVTEEGLRRFEAGETIRRRVAHEMTQRLTSQELDQLIMLLSRIANQ